MKATLVIHDRVMIRLKEEAARTGKTLSELVEAALRTMLDHQVKPTAEELPPLPTFRGGPPLVGISDRDALYQAMAWC